MPGIDNATLYLAKQQGLFSSAGINVQIRDYSTVAKEISALSSGQVNIAGGDYAEFFFAQTSAQIYRILADGYDAQAGVTELMTMPNTQLTSPSQLSGKTVYAPNTDLINSMLPGAPDSLAIAATTSVLQSYGVNLSQVTWKTTSQTQEIQLLLQGKAQAVLLTQPYVYLAEQQGAVQLADPYSGATAGLPLSGYFSTKAWTTQNAAAATAFQHGLAQAAGMAAMPGPLQKILPTYADLTKQETALITTGAYPVSTIPASLQRTADLMNTEGMIRSRPNVTAIVWH